MDNLQSLPDEIKTIYEHNFSTIKTRVIQGRIKSMYHFLITGTYDISEYIAKIKADQSGSVKINVAFGFILKHKLSGELRFFHPSHNSTIFKLPVKISNDDDYKKLQDDLEKQDLLEYADTQRPTTKWKVLKLVCIRFDVYRLEFN